MIRTNLFLKAKIVERFGSQADFAEKLHKAPSVVSETVNGRRVLRGTEAKLWTRLLKCPVEYLFKQD